MPFPLWHMQTPDRPPPPVNSGMRVLQDASNSMIEHDLARQRQAEEERAALAREALTGEQIDAQRDQTRQQGAQQGGKLALDTREYEWKRMQEEDKLAKEKATRLRNAMYDYAAADETGQEQKKAMINAELHSLGYAIERPGIETPAQPPAPVQTDLTPMAAPLPGSGLPIPQRPPPVPTETVQAGPIPPEVSQFMDTQLPAREVWDKYAPEPSPSEGQPAPTAVSPPTAPAQGALQGAPPLGMGLPTPQMPQAPPPKPESQDRYVLRELATGTEVTSWNHAEVRQQAYDALKNQFADVLQATDPVVRQQAEVAYTLHRGRIGFTPISKVLADAAKDALSLRRALGAKGIAAPGGGGGLPSIKRERLDLSTAKDLNGAVNDVIKEVEKSYGLVKANEIERDVQEVQRNLADASNAGAGVQQEAALNRVIKIFQGGRPSDPDYARLANSAGMWTAAENYVGRWMNRGIKADEFIAGLRATMNAISETVAEKRAQASQAAEEEVHRSPFISRATDPREVGFQADRAQGYFSHNYRMKREQNPAGERRIGAPKPKAVARDRDLGDD